MSHHWLFVGSKLDLWFPKSGHLARFSGPKILAMGGVSDSATQGVSGPYIS